MQFIDLQTQYQSIKDEIQQRVQRVLEHGRYIMGPEVDELEQQLADYVGVNYCIGMSDGTKALLIAMMALDIGAGDEVITTPFTFIATAEMIQLLGAKPIFADIDPATYNLDPQQIEQAITPRTKAIVAVSLFGQCADFDAINAIATRHRLAVIEDGAQSFGATYRGQRSCGLTTIATTSFFPSKPLGCYGDGGACFTQDEDLASKIKAMRVHGETQRYYHQYLGLNARLDTIQAAVLLTKLNQFPCEIITRQRAAAIYNEQLAGYVQTPWIASQSTSVYAQYTIATAQRDELQQQLKQRNIPTAIYYPRPLHLQPVFQGLGYGPGDFPVSERAAHQVLSLPMGPTLSSSQCKEVSTAVIKAWQTLAFA